MGWCRRRITDKVIRVQMVPIVWCLILYRFFLDSTEPWILKYTVTKIAKLEEKWATVNLKRARILLVAVSMIKIRSERPKRMKLFPMMPTGRIKNIIGFLRMSEMRLIWPRWSRNTPHFPWSCRPLMTKSSYIGHYSTTVCLAIKEYSWRKNKRN